MREEFVLFLRLSKTSLPYVAFASWRVDDDERFGPWPDDGICRCFINRQKTTNLLVFRIVLFKFLENLFLLCILKGSSIDIIKHFSKDLNFHWFHSIKRMMIMCSVKNSHVSTYIYVCIFNTFSLLFRGELFIVLSLSASSSCMLSVAP